MKDKKPKVGEYWLCETVSIMGNGNSTSVHKMSAALIVSCNVKPIERLYTESDMDKVKSALSMEVKAKLKIKKKYSRVMQELSK